MIDPSFANEGEATLSLGAASGARKVMVQPGGKIVVAGWWTKSFPNGKTYGVLARYKPDGSLDPGFGTRGVVTTAFGALNQNNP